MSSSDVIQFHSPSLLAMGPSLNRGCGETKDAPAEGVEGVGPRMHVQPITYLIDIICVFTPTETALCSQPASSPPSHLFVKRNMQYQTMSLPVK